jgi:hypothetical protein
VAYTCNPCYLGGKDQEDRSSRPAQAKSLQDPTSKMLNTKKSWQSGSGGILNA